MRLECLLLNYFSYKPPPLAIIGMTKFNNEFQKRNIFIVSLILISNTLFYPVTRTIHFVDIVNSVTRTIDIVNHYHTVIKTGNV